MENDIEIEYLPLMGSPLSFKTISQGRQKTLNELKKDDYNYGNRTYRKKDIYNADKISLTCKTIINHPKASSRQKASAQRMLEIIEKNWVININFAKLIYGIARNLRHRKVG